MTGICKCLTDWFQPGTNTEHLTQKDGYQMCSKLFKVRANDILDLILHHGFTKEAVGQLRSLKTKDQGDVFMTKVKKRAREEPNDGLKHRLHFQAAHDGEQPANGTQVMLMDKFGELYDDQDTTYREANTITTKVLPGIRCFEIDNMDKGPWRQPRHHLWLEGPDRDPGEALVKRWIVAAAAASWQRHLRPAQQHWFKLQGVAVESKPPSKPSNHRICLSDLSGCKARSVAQAQQYQRLHGPNPRTISAWDLHFPPQIRHWASIHTNRFFINKHVDSAAYNSGFWDFLGFKLPEFAQQYIDCGVSCSRGVEDDSITSPKGKRDYICLVDNMLIIAGEDKTSKTQMAEADNDLIKKHVGSNRAMYGRLQYIVLIGTAGSDLKFNVMSVIPGTGLQELFPAMEVASPVNRQKALSMFINLVRWVRTVHDHRLLPKHRHSLFKSMPRPSPYPDLIGYHFANQVTLKLNHVKKSIAVPFSHLDTLVKTYRMLASGAIPGACQVVNMEKMQAGCGTWRCELDHLETEACWNASAHCQQQSVLQPHHAVASDLDRLAQAKLGS
ncbi:hypothetical protein WJX77_002388 [Trebouxia sp. C0004]